MIALVQTAYSLRAWRKTRAYGQIKGKKALTYLEAKEDD